MAPVKILTLKRAADELGTYRQRVLERIAAGELTPATVDERPAVVDDPKFRRAVRKAAA